MEAVENAEDGCRCDDTCGQTAHEERYRAAAGMRTRVGSPWEEEVAVCLLLATQLAKGDKFSFLYQRPATHARLSLTDRQSEALNAVKTRKTKLSVTETRT